MKEHNIHQEILLLTKSSFASREWAKNKEDKNERMQTELEQFEEACWNGLVREMLPEVFGQPQSITPLTLWQVYEAESFLDLELGESPVDIDKFHSINPYLFFSLLPQN